LDMEWIWGFQLAGQWMAEVVLIQINNSLIIRLDYLGFLKRNVTKSQCIKKVAVTVWRAISICESDIGKYDYRYSDRLWIPSLESSLWIVISDLWIRERHSDSNVLAFSCTALSVRFHRFLPVKSNSCQDPCWSDASVSPKLVHLGVKWPGLELQDHSTHRAFDRANPANEWQSALTFLIMTRVLR
jgi:hypothetical protein